MFTIKVQSRKATLNSARENLPTGSLNYDKIRFTVEGSEWNGAVLTATFSALLPSGARKTLPAVVNCEGIAIIPEKILSTKGSLLSAGLSGSWENGSRITTNMVDICKLLPGSAGDDLQNEMNSAVDQKDVYDYIDRKSHIHDSDIERLDNESINEKNERFISDLNIKVPDEADSDSYLFETDYSANNFDYNFANKELEKRYVPSGACSAVRKGSLVGRNFDWFYNNTADVVVRTSRINGRYASIGIAQVSGLTAEKLNSRNPDDIDDYKILPFLTLDGVNENGVYCSINVTSGERGITTGTNPGAERLCGLAIVRFVIDYAESAANAVELLQDMDIWVPHSDSISYEYHFLICDRTESYIVEFVDNTMVYFKCEDSERNPAAIITNFPLVSIDGNSWYDGNHTSREEATEDTDFFRSSEHPSGVERFDILKSEFDEITNKNSLSEVMQKVRFTEAYNRETNPFWYSEFSGDFGEYGNLAWGTPVEEYADIINDKISDYEDERESGERTSRSWQTTHTAIYNLNSLELSVFTQEDYDREYKFQLVEQSDFDETNTKSRNYIKNKPTKLSDFENDLEIKTAIEIVESGNTSKFKGSEILSMFSDGNILLYNGYPILNVKEDRGYVWFSVIIDDVYTTYHIATYNKFIDYETSEKHFFEDKDVPISTGKNYLRNGNRYWVEADTLFEKTSYVGKLEIDPDAQGLRFIWSAGDNNSYTYMRIAYNTGAKIYARLQIGASSYMFLASTEQTVDTFYFDGVLTVAGQIQYCRLSIDSSDIILHTENVVNAIEDVQVNGISIISNKIANIDLSDTEHKVYTGKLQITSQSPMTLAWISETGNSYADMRAAYNNGSKVEIALMTGVNQWTKLACTTYDSSFFSFQLPLRLTSSAPIVHYFIVIDSNGISVINKQIAFADDIPVAAGDISYDSTVAYSSGTVGKALSDLNSEINGINDLVGSGVIE